MKRKSNLSFFITIFVYIIYLSLTAIKAEIVALYQDLSCRKDVESNTKFKIYV